MVKAFIYIPDNLNLIDTTSLCDLQSSSSYGIRSYGIHSQIPWYGMASGLLPNALSPLENTSHMEYPRYGMGLAGILAGFPTLFHTRNSTVLTCPTFFTV
jgi:hypothetical protein